MKLVVPTTAQKNDPLYQLERIETRIRASDEKGLQARWDSGKKLCELREANYEKTLEDIAEHLGVSRGELSSRMRFAESDQALVDAINKGWSWFDVVHRMTELVGRKRAPKKGKRSVVVKEFSLLIRRVRTDLKKVHAGDLTDADWKCIDTLQEEIARLIEEANSA